MGRITFMALLGLAAGVSPALLGAGAARRVPLTVEAEESTEMLETCREEIAGLHAFFQAWFRGELAPTDVAFERFAGVLAPDFEMVAPSGERLTRDEVLAGVRAAHGAGREQAMRVWTRNERVRAIAQGIWVATYEEWQEKDGAERARVSTVLLRAKRDAPGAVEWLHVHETWMP